MGLIYLITILDSLSNFFFVLMIISLLLSIIITIVFAGVMTFIIVKVIKLFGDIRVSEESEAEGLDITEHSESAYPSFNGLD